MGWLFQHTTRSRLVRELTETRETQRGGVRTLKIAWKGWNTLFVLYERHSQGYDEDGEWTCHVTRGVTCILLRSIPSAGEWGYKEIGFDSGYLAPISWMDQMTDTEPGGYYHEKAVEMRAAAERSGHGVKLSAGDIVFLDDGRSAEVVQPRPLRIRIAGEYGRWRCKRSQIDWRTTMLARGTAATRSNRSAAHHLPTGTAYL